MPEGGIVLHSFSDFFLLVVLYFITEVPLQKLIEADLVLVFSSLTNILGGFYNDTMSYLSVKYMGTVNSILVYQS